MLAKILDYLTPDWEGVIIGEPTTAKEYADNVTWLDNRTQPTWKEIETAKTQVEKNLVNNEAKQARAAAFRAESDPLFFAWQRGESDEQTWVNKVAEIRSRYPYVE